MPLLLPLQQKRTISTINRDVSGRCISASERTEEYICACEAKAKKKKFKRMTTDEYKPKERQEVDHENYNDDYGKERTCVRAVN